MIRWGDRSGRLRVHLLLCRSCFGLNRSKWVFRGERHACPEQATGEIASNPEFITAVNCPVPNPEYECYGRKRFSGRGTERLVLPRHCN